MILGPILSSSWRSVRFWNGFWLQKCPPGGPRNPENQGFRVDRLQISRFSHFVNPIAKRKPTLTRTYEDIQIYLHMCGDPVCLAALGVGECGGLFGVQNRFKIEIRVRRPQNPSWRASGAEQNCWVPSRRPPGEFLGEISPLQGGGRPLWASFWEPLGLILALLFAIGVKNAKISQFAYNPYENLDFQGSGGLPGHLFGA